MMNNIKYFFITIILMPLFAKAQTNTLSNSPYSLYGLGVTNLSSTGTTNALGNLGIAIGSTTSINNINPASYALLNSNSFLYDIGLKAQFETLIEHGTKETKSTGNFSNLAIAFPITKKSGFGLTLIPFTDVGYSLSGIKTNIEGYNSYFITNVEGSGGLNNFKLNYGYSLTNKLRLGVAGSVLFGNIKQIETNTIANKQLIIDEQNNYAGFRAEAGLQFDVFKNTTLGAIINLPVTLSGSQTRIVSQTNEDDIETEDDIDNFKIPLELGFGVKTNIKSNLAINLDYKANFWSNTNQKDAVGYFVNQNIFGAGIEYIPEKKYLTSKKMWVYRGGFNFDNGNLKIDDERVTNYSFNLGVGIPVNKRNNSMLNLAYTYGRKGYIYDGLIKENYHLLNVNLNLEGVWFRKTKIY